MWKLSATFVFACLYFSTPAAAKSLSASEVPSPLKPWISWSLHGNEKKTCPFIFNRNNNKICAWPGRLHLEINSKSGSFKQLWELYTSDYVTIPGNTDHWPLKVRVDGVPKPVIERQGHPAVYISKGVHEIEGAFLWDKIPESLRISNESALLTTKVRGKTITSPRISGDTIYFQNKIEDDSHPLSDSLDYKVFRKLSDKIPLEMVTRINFIVGGSNREITIGPVLSKDFKPAFITSSLPTRLEASGKLRVQVRPGRHSIDITAHKFSETAEITIPKQTDSKWPDEIWSFKSQNHLRLVTIEGANSVDPKQTEVPAEWKSLPAYHMEADTKFTIRQRKRGDPEPAPDKLSLNREIWLDFDGGGYTVQDLITGKVSRSWRLELLGGPTLGSVTVNKESQLVTRKAGSAGNGVELRSGKLNMAADFRINEKTNKIPSGWDTDFQSAKATLHLPPGWKLITALGVDKASGSWITKWDLMNIFLVLIVALTIAKLRSPLWGAVAFVTLFLVIPESSGPSFEWLFLLPAMGLLKVLPDGKAKIFTNIYYRFLGLIIVCTSLLFMIQQVQQAMHPNLEYPSINLQMIYGDSSIRNRVDKITNAVSKPEAKNPMQQEESSEYDSLDDALEKGAADQILGSAGNAPVPSSPSRYKNSKPKSSSGGNGRQLTQTKQYDPNAIIQTGPGIPQWNWNNINLAWHGPLDKGQGLSLILLPPWLNGALNFLRVGLLALLIFAVFSKDFKNGWPVVKKFARSGLLALVMGSSIFSASDIQAEIPSDQMLKELSKRMLSPAECLPVCANVSRMMLTSQKENLSISLEVHADALVSIPLPGQAESWWPTNVTIDGKKATSLKKINDQLWVVIPTGRHNVQLHGRLNSSTTQLNLPLPPSHLTTNTPGYDVDGLLPDGKVGTSLAISKKTKNNTKKQSDPLEPGNLPPLIRVERTITLGLIWSIDTTVTKLNASKSSAIIRIPLIAGEQVATDGLQVQKNHAVINLTGTNSISWSSSLKIGEQIALRAAATNRWTEVWRLNISPVWHVNFTGSPVIHHVVGGTRNPTWLPWPGEEVAINISRPEAAKGQSITLEASHLEVTPGKRSTEVTLSATLRSSRGGDHKIKLPIEANLQSLKINGTDQPIRPEKGILTLPISPGKQYVEINWRQKLPMKTMFKIPSVDLGMSGVNGKTTLNMPESRWVLLARGAGSGPAILFWSQLLVILLASIFIGKIPLTPLKWHHWFLLGMGLAQESLDSAVVIVGLFIALGVRKKTIFKAPWLHNLVQMGIAIWTFVAVICVLVAINNGFFGKPDMQIRGNGSSSTELMYYVDQTIAVIGDVWVLSVPVLIFQGTMLCWALWFAYKIINWSKWGYEAISYNGLFKRITPITNFKSNPVPATAKPKNPGDQKPDSDPKK